MKKRQLRWTASYTVEAAFVVPICTMVVLLLIGQVLFYRDVVVAERVAMSAAEEGARYRLYAALPGKTALSYERFRKEGVLQSGSSEVRSQDERTIAGYTEELLQGKLWFACQGKVTVDIQGNYVNVSFAVDAPYSVTDLFGYGKRSVFHRMVSVTAEGQDIAEDNRVILTAWETASRIRGLSEILGKLQTLLGKILG